MIHCILQVTKVVLYPMYHYPNLDPQTSLQISQTIERVPHKYRTKQRLAALTHRNTHRNILLRTMRKSIIQFNNLVPWVLNKFGVLFLRGCIGSSNATTVFNVGIYCLRCTNCIAWLSVLFSNSSDLNWNWKPCDCCYLESDDIDLNIVCV